MTDKKMEVAEVKENYPALKKDSDIGEIIQANIGNSSVSRFDLPQVKMPTGGDSFFKLRTLKGEEPVKEISGIVVYWKEPRAFWRESFDQSGGGTPPDCSSPDGVMGFGEPGGPCKTCPFAQWGSATDQKGNPTKGQACKQMRALFILREGSLLPVVLVLPPTSVGVLRSFNMMLAAEGKRYSDLITTFRLETAQNTAGIKYSKVEAVMEDELDEETIARVREYQKAITPALEEAEVDMGYETKKDQDDGEDPGVDISADSEKEEDVEDGEEG